MSMKSECECAPTPKPTTSRPPPCESSRHCFCASVVPPLRCVVQHVKHQLSKSAVYHYRRVCFGLPACASSPSHTDSCSGRGSVCGPRVCVWDRATLTVKNSHYAGMLRNNNTRVPVQEEEEDLDDLDEGEDVLLLCHVSGPSFCSVCDNHEIRTWKRTFC